MSASCTIQLFAAGAWHEVASVSLFGDVREGWRARSYTGYDVAWAMEHQGARDAHALSCRLPVRLDAFDFGHWPVFLIDLLPQGYGRAELLRGLGLPEAAAEPADWPLLLAGAGNPIGHLRVKEAAEWLLQQQRTTRGFTDQDVARRSDAFIEHLGAQGLFVAGSSGVQGEWPKLLLTRSRDGLLYLDHALPDAEAVEHFIVKFGRGSSERLDCILRHEAPYMALARHLGLRVHAELVRQERALFIPRFDRRICGGGVQRLAQESIASLTGQPGFGVLPSHDTVCLELLRRCSEPQVEVLEYLRRDVANLALGNKDNHARNTALQRDFEGRVALTPLYDFAPMVLHPDGMARRIRWEGNDDGKPDWARVLDAVCRLRESARADQAVALSRAALADGLRAMAPALADIAARGQAMGLEPELHAFLRPGLERLARELDALR